MRNKRRPRSGLLGPAQPVGATASRHDNRRQAFYKEVIVDPDIMVQIIESDLHQSNCEELEQARQDLAEHIVAKAPEVLTEKQWAALSMWLTGKYSQQQIADHLGVAQTTIYKTLNGNDAYREDGTCTRYGGVSTKLRLWAQTDERTQELLQKIAELVGELS